MTDVQFGEDQDLARLQSVATQSAIVSLVLKSGLVKTERQAQYVLLVGALLLIGLSFFVWRATSPSTSGGIDPTDPEQVQLMADQASTPSI